MDNIQLASSPEELLSEVDRRAKENRGCLSGVVIVILTELLLAVQGLFQRPNDFFGGVCYVLVAVCAGLFAYFFGSWLEYRVRRWHHEQLTVRDDVISEARRVLKEKDAEKTALQGEIAALRSPKPRLTPTGVIVRRVEVGERPEFEISIGNYGNALAANVMLTLSVSQGKNKFGETTNNVGHIPVEKEVAPKLISPTPLQEKDISGLRKGTLAIQLEGFVHSDADTPPEDFCFSSSKQTEIRNGTMDLIRCGEEWKPPIIIEPSFVESTAEIFPPTITRSTPDNEQLDRPPGAKGDRET